MNHDGWVVTRFFQILAPANQECSYFHKSGQFRLQLIFKPDLANVSAAAACSMLITDKTIVAYLSNDVFAILISVARKKKNTNFIVPVIPQISSKTSKQ